MGDCVVDVGIGLADMGAGQAGTDAGSEDMGAGLADMGADSADMDAGLAGVGAGVAAEDVGVVDAGTDGVGEGSWVYSSEQALVPEGPLQAFCCGNSLVRSSPGRSMAHRVLVLVAASLEKKTRLGLMFYLRKKNLSFLHGCVCH